MVQAFHATLEEAALADAIVVLSDAASPYLHQHIKTVQEVLESLGAADAPQIHALNKADLLTDHAAAVPGALLVSALHGDGIDALLAQIEDTLFQKKQSYRVFVPFQAYHTLNQFRKAGVVHEQAYQDDGVVLLVEAELSMMKSLLKEGIRLLDDEIV